MQFRVRLVHSWPNFIQFSNHPEGRQARDMWHHASLQPLWQKQEGQWPAVSVKTGQWKPSRLFSEVSRDVGWTVPGQRGRSSPVKRRSASPAAGEASGVRRRS